MAMTCRVLLFAQLADAVGIRELELHIEPEWTVDRALERLASEHAAIASLRANLAVAIDDAYATPSTRLTDGCVLALIPPVSGG
jgi:molybdopterin synthase catalytic subunit